MSGQIDIAVDLGVLRSSMPGILDVENLVARRRLPPPQIIEGILHQGCR
jgi:hypothetical protein